MSDEYFEKKMIEMEEWYGEVVGALQEEIEELRKRITMLEYENERLRWRIQELEDELRRVRGHSI